jgi:hypothetical protein
MKTTVQHTMHQAIAATLRMELPLVEALIDTTVETMIQRHLQTMIEASIIKALEKETIDSRIERIVSEIKTRT